MLNETPNDVGKPRTKRTSPTQRSLRWLRDNGYQAQVVERWNPHARIRQDLFGCIDIIAIGNGEIIGVQATTGDNLAKRREKSRPLAKAWIVHGGIFELHGWSKQGARGERKLWTLRRERLAESAPGQEIDAQRSRASVPPVLGVDRTAGTSCDMKKGRAQAVPHGQD